MIVSQALDVIDENVNVYVRDALTKELITCYDGKNSIAEHVLIDTVERMTITKDGNGIVLEIMYSVTDFDDLNGEAKLKCLHDYIYKICPYDHFDDMSIAEIEECAWEFWRQSDYTLDKDGNWYDEDFQKI
jgi:hypothetical protein